MKTMREIITIIETIKRVPVIDFRKKEIDEDLHQGTASFRAWFGDSKVIDSSGKPLVCYHGTSAPKDFVTFETIRGGDLGAHFGNIEQAHDFTQATGTDRKNRIIPVFLSIKNPLRLPDLGRWHAAEMIPCLKKMGIDIKLPERVYVTGNFFDNEMENYYNYQREIIKALEHHGYDGIVYHNDYEGAGDSWIAFRPSQIKSAIGNNGAFDSASDNITEDLIVNYPDPKGIGAS